MIRTIQLPSVVILLAVVVVLGSVFVSWTKAQTDSPTTLPRDLRIAVIDMGRLKAGSELFRQGLASISAEAANLQNDYEQKAAALKKTSNLFDSRDPNDDPDAMDEEFALAAERARVREIAEANNRHVQQLQIEFYARFHQATRKALHEYCGTNGISLVLSHTSGRIGELRQETLQAALSQTVVYQNGLDITDEIIGRLNQLAAKDGS